MTPQQAIGHTESQDSRPDTGQWPPEPAHLSYWDLMSRRVQAVAAASPDAARTLAELTAIQECVPLSRRDDENILTATVRAGDIPGLKSAALDKARELYGPGAAVEVEGIPGIFTSARGGFLAHVRVRRMASSQEQERAE